MQKPRRVFLKALGLAPFIPAFSPLLRDGTAVPEATPGDTGPVAAPGADPVPAPTSRAGYAARRRPTAPHSPVKPPALRPGDAVVLVNPAGATYETVDVEIARESLEALGLEVRVGEHLLERRGYLAGTDEERAADVNEAFADPAIAGVFAMRGGWGSARVLPLIDYETIRENPKILIGYSDITALLLGIYARTGLVTFHGPVGISSWDPFTVDHLRRVLFEGEAATLRNPRRLDDALTQTEHRVQTITPGRARGVLAGGNLSVLTGIVGSGYLPDWDGTILFLEDVGEDIYRVDRMLTQLRLAGVLERIEGFIFGRCSDCDPGGGYGSLTLEQVLADHIAPLGIPAWYGSMIGHIDEIFTVPVGIGAEIDATEGTIQLLEPAVR